jgi:flagellar protein FlbD
MIVVTRLNDTQFAVNPDLIERIHANPDTTLVMVDGAKYIVTESMSEIIERIAQYRARVVALAQTLSATNLPQPGWQLGLLTPTDPADHANGEPGNTLPLRPRK